MPPRAVIYIPPGEDRAKWMPRCLQHCERHGYLVVAIIADTAGAWRDVFGMLSCGEADVAVIGKFDHLPSDRLPRVEEATDYGGTPGRRRPRSVR